MKRAAKLAAVTVTPTAKPLTVTDVTGFWGDEETTDEMMLLLDEIAALADVLSRAKHDDEPVLLMLKKKTAAAKHLHAAQLHANGEPA